MEEERVGLEETVFVPCSVVEGHEKSPTGGKPRRGATYSGNGGNPSNPSSGSG